MTSYFERARAVLRGLVGESAAPAVPGDEAPGLVERVGQLGRVVFGDDVEGVLRHAALAEDGAEALDDGDHGQGHAHD